MATEERRSPAGTVAGSQAAVAMGSEDGRRVGERTELEGAQGGEGDERVSEAIHGCHSLTPDAQRLS